MTSKNLLETLQKHLNPDQACRKAYAKGFTAGFQAAKEDRLSAWDKLNRTPTGQLWRSLDQIWLDASYIDAHLGNYLDDLKIYARRILKTYETAGAEFDKLLKKDPTEALK